MKKRTKYNLMLWLMAAAGTTAVWGIASLIIVIGSKYPVALFTFMAIAMFVCITNTLQHTLRQSCRDLEAIMEIDKE